MRAARGIEVAALIAVVVGTAISASACHVLGLQASACASDDNCPSGTVCSSSGECVADDARAEGEGEGVVVAEGEGEGVVVVAEGEGEGVVVAEGEGEGVVVVAEGEGEGVVIVAEGEGEGAVVAEGEGEGEVVVVQPAGLASSLTRVGTTTYYLAGGCVRGIGVTGPAALCDPTKLKAIAGDGEFLAGAFDGGVGSSDFVKRVNLTTSAVTTVSSLALALERAGGAFAAADGHVRWLEVSRSQDMSLGDLAPGASTPTYSKTASAFDTQGLTAAGSHFYFVDVVAGLIESIYRQDVATNAAPAVGGSVNSGAAVVASTARSAPHAEFVAFAFDDGSIFFGDGLTATIRTVETSTGHARASAIALDDTHVWWTTDRALAAGEPPALHRCRLDGSAPEVVTTLGANASSLLVDDAFVFWIEPGLNAGRIVRRPKPSP